VNAQVVAALGERQRYRAGPADIGAAVAMLCGPGAELITGQTIHVDGGASVMDPLAPLALQNG
jgi:enoyl-[acyl-carrier-protein] reductase (NADH)